MKRLMLLAGLLLLDPFASATTYCVSNSGSDSNTGTATAANCTGTVSAWLTIAHVNAQTFSAGDSVLFQSGGVWRESLLFPSSGTSGSPITIGSYGTGALPVINGANLLSSGWSTTGSNIWTVTDSTQPQQVFFNQAFGTLVGSSGAVTAAGDWFWSSNTLYVYSTSNPATAFTNPGVEASTRTYGIRTVGKSNLVIQNIEVRYDNQQFGESGIVIANSTSNVVINGVVADWNWGTGINIVDENGAGTLTGITVKNSQVYFNGEAGIQAVPFSSGNSSSYTSISILNNSVHNNSQDTATQFTGGIHVGTPPNFAAYAITSCLIQGNAAYLNGYNAAGASIANANSGPGVWMDTTSGCTADFNLTYQNAMQGIFVENGQANVVSYNIAYGHTNTAVSFPFHASGFAVGDTSLTTLIAQSNLFYNNTAYGNSLGFTVFGGIPSTVTVKNNTLSNNIAIGNTVNFAAYAGGENQTTTIGGGSGNVYTFNAWGTAASGFIGWSCTSPCATPSNLITYATYATWEAATGNCGTTGCSNSIQIAPTFTNAGSNDFTLLASSSAIGSGTSLGQTYAFGLLPGTSWPSNVNYGAQNTNWNIGAYLTSSGGQIAGTIRNAVLQ